MFEVRISVIFPSFYKIEAWFEIHQALASQFSLLVYYGTYCHKTSTRPHYWTNFHNSIMSFSTPKCDKICLITFMYVIIVFIQKYAHTCSEILKYVRSILSYFQKYEISHRICTYE